MSALRVTVYTAGPGCMACTQTKRHLDRRGIHYDEIKLSDGDRGTLDALQYLGFTQAPVVCAATPDGTETAWQGYRPDRLDALAAVLS